MIFSVCMTLKELCKLAIIKSSDPTGMVWRLKLLITIIFYCIYSQNISACPPDTILQSERMAGVCKVWGLIKYYQPKVSKKKIDWDGVLLKCYNNFDNLNDFQGYNENLKALLSGAEIIPRAFSASDSLKAKQVLNGELSKLNNFAILNDTVDFIRQPDFRWIGNNSLFSNEIQKLLFQVIIDYKPVTSRYLKGSETIFHAENPFSNIDSVSEAYRMLALFRYWNIVNYFYPYKNLTDKSWDSVLTENIPLFEKANSYNGYFRNVLHLTSEINDTHAWGTFVDPKKAIKHQGGESEHHPMYFPPFKIKLLDNNVMISQLLNDSLRRSGLLQEGDILIKVNNNMVNKAVEKFRYYTPASTKQSFESSANESLIFNLKDTLNFDFSLLRGTDTLNVSNIKGLNGDSYWKDEKDTVPACYKIGDSTGYINLAKAKVKDLKKAYRQYKNFPALIFDMRGYPNSWGAIFLPKMFSRKPVMTANYFYPSKKYAGVFVKSKAGENYFVENNFALLVKSLFNVKKKIMPTSNKIYQGKVVVLINNEAVSAAETVCMIFKAYAKNLTFIGTPTEGANGDVIDFYMPGGIVVNFSSIDWHFPNGQQLQRIGIIPDITVQPSVKTTGKDEILERAIRFARTGK